MACKVALIGFGEAAQAFAAAANWGSAAAAFDIRTDAEKRADYARVGVTPCASARDALAGAPAALSLVTADAALAVARETARDLGAGAFWFDMNSVAPETKRAAEAAIAAAGGRYVDVAVMAPVHPKRTAVPLLVSGPHADAGASVLEGLGFQDVRCVGAKVGDASAIKMIRSVMVKGIEALTAECVLAAHRANVVDAVLSSLGEDWAQKADYNLDRMLAHGLRRAAEMEEAARTLEDLGVAPLMTRGTIARQRALGTLGIAPPEGLAAKLAALGSLNVPA
ncbi:NAD(P)-dependent oxidoreductase [Sphingosinicella soli]|uniref:3-hydroxyisobutyrate dehydrogenase-like beta-hydroxyacid dehydrogenase n=1 Tax=Sphingosinicella soli TaxID=333708 RepID=A0A7W7F739_9SPHN|nr:NAD(P)-dependent oxidoreductase [Sphingosinicella soli]MBB4633021.1 3-hydroxyisobutyrate dehydrogenase-like beta-hydroxyacid dehydrogenase [Sphingosinicella soli]